jgi:hypothetical protein
MSILSNIKMKGIWIHEFYLMEDDLIFKKNCNSQIFVEINKSSEILVYSVSSLIER